MTSRRTVLGLSTAAAFASLPAVSSDAHSRQTLPALESPVPETSALTLWYPAPAAADAMIQEGLPVGNGRLGALAGGDPAGERLLVTDGTLWTGGRNDVLDGDGQFPYDQEHFGTFTLLAELAVSLSGHSLAEVSDYRRQLDLAAGLITITYVLGGVTYRREIYASHPGDVIVVRLTQDGGGTHTGTIALAGTHGETTSADPAKACLTVSAAFDNDLKYAAAVTAKAEGAGTVVAGGSGIAFTGCTGLTVVLSGGTNYAPTFATGYRDERIDPLQAAVARAVAAARIRPADLLRAHVADHRRLFDRLTVDFGPSSAGQRALDTWQRLQARAAADAPPDPEFEAAYLQFGRYLMICGSRDGMPLNLQGLWLDGNTPDWMGDYHTDVNIQMNYWLADRGGLSPSFDAFTDYLLAQAPSWTEITQAHFNDPRNRFRNTSGRVAGWTVAFSTNVHGGNGWWWHPGGSAWLCLNLWEHYEYTQDRSYLARILPLLRGACEFWEARLISTIVTTPVTKGTSKVLIDDHDWSPEHGPQDARGITYAQELVWSLFENYRTACAELGQDSRYSRVIRDLQEQLYLPEVSPKSGWLQEWMSPDNLGETTHRHLSPLMGLFPGDRIRPGAVSDTIVAGATSLLTARGMDSFGWANAWRAACWARLRNAANAYQLVMHNLRPAIDHGNGSAMNLFDMYQVDSSRNIFQIDANFGTPSAMIEMLVYSRPGHVELLPALPAAWAREGSITGVGIRGGFVLDLQWRAGQVTGAKFTSVGGRSTSVRFGSATQTVRLKPGASTVLHGLEG
jgi:alpha-L-fucosidase 2